MARRHKDAGPEAFHPDERWLVTWNDTLTLLLAVFIVLYGLSDVNIRKFTALAQSLSSVFSTDIFQATKSITVMQGQETAPDDGSFDSGEGVLASDYRTVEATIRDYAIEAGLEGKVSVDRVPDGIALRISDSLLFDNGRARLDDRAHSIVARLAEIVRPLPNALRVEGHTDDIPPQGPFFRDNWDLSTTRALAVLGALSDLGIPAQRLSAAGYAEHQPLVPNTDDEARARNRRVDILILYAPDPSVPLPGETAHPFSGGLP